MKSLVAIALSLLSLGAGPLNGDECPMHAAHMKAAPSSRLDAVNERGDQAMGFDHSKAVHHFLLLPDGGAIQVEGTDLADSKNRGDIRRHLGHIADQFTDGVFEIPMFIHDQVLPGVPTMKKRRKAIAYSYEPTEKGGRVRITTHDPTALAAVHDFLKFQISDHATGDSLEVGASR